jgi:hypothetical protein
VGTGALAVTVIGYKSWSVRVPADNHSAWLLVGTEAFRKDASYKGPGNAKEFIMRSHPMLAATALLATGILAPAIGSAQNGPSAEQIIKSLTPGPPTTITHRGIRIAPPGAMGSRERQRQHPRQHPPSASPYNLRTDPPNLRHKQCTSSTT